MNNPGQTKPKTATKTIRVQAGDLDYLNQLITETGSVSDAFSELVNAHKAHKEAKQAPTQEPTPPPIQEPTPTPTPIPAPTESKNEFNSENCTVSLNNHCIALLNFVNPTQNVEYFVNLGVALAIRHEHPKEFRLFMANNVNKDKNDTGKGN
jgi:hypothetical protein